MAKSTITLAAPPADEAADALLEAGKLIKPKKPGSIKGILAGAAAVSFALGLLATVTGTGRHRAQITYFFRMQIGSRTPSGIDLGSGGPLRRIRRFSGLSRELWIENFGKSWASEMSG